MSDQRLQDMLARLRAHLSAAPQMRPTEREQLDKAIGAIGAIGSDAGTGDAGTLLRLERLAVRFEASHPKLAETLREIADTLAKGGI
jgi:hypothetical protein